MVFTEEQKVNEPGEREQPENPVGNATRLEPGIFAKLTSSRSSCSLV